MERDRDEKWARLSFITPEPEIQKVLLKYICIILEKVHFKNTCTWCINKWKTQSADQFFFSFENYVDFL